MEIANRTRSRTQAAKNARDDLNSDPEPVKILSSTAPEPIKEQRFMPRHYIILSLIVVALVANSYKPKILLQNYQNQDAYHLFPWQKPQDQAMSFTPPDFLFLHLTTAIGTLLLTFLTWITNDKTALGGKMSVLRMIQNGAIHCFLFFVIPFILNFGENPWYVGLLANGFLLLHVVDGWFAGSDFKVLCALLAAPMFEVVYFFVYTYL